MSSTYENKVKNKKKMKMKRNKSYIAFSQYKY